MNVLIYAANISPLSVFKMDLDKNNNLFKLHLDRRKHTQPMARAHTYTDTHTQTHTYSQNMCSDTFRYFEETDVEPTVESLN